MSTAVLNSEVVKLITCLYVVYTEYGNIPQWFAALKTTVIDQPMDTLKVCVPSLVYVVQNNLLYIAASHLDAATYQVRRSYVLNESDRSSTCIFNGGVIFINSGDISDEDSHNRSIQRNYFTEEANFLPVASSSDPLSRCNIGPAGSV